MKKPLKSAKFIIGFSLGMVLSGAAAYGIGVTNTPETGYVLCVNAKTKELTYTGTMKCPKGTSSLELGARGLPGSRGAAGAVGPAGDATQNVYFKVVPSRDLETAPIVNASADLKTVILATIYPNDMPLGFYELDAHISGVWKKPTVINAPAVSCYFQYKKDFDADRSVVFGIDGEDYVRWSGINVNPLGELDFHSNLDDPMLLVCKSSGSITGLSGIIHATPFTDYLPMKSTSPMIPRAASSF